MYVYNYRCLNWKFLIIHFPKDSLELLITFVWGTFCQSTNDQWSSKLWIPPPPKYESEFDIDNGTHQGFRPRIYVTKTENWETGTSTGNRKMKKWKQSRELEMNLVIGLRFQLGFFLILHFCRFACSFPLPVPCLFTSLCPLLLKKSVKVFSAWGRALSYLALAGTCR